MRLMYKETYFNKTEDREHVIVYAKEISEMHYEEKVGLVLILPNGEKYAVLGMNYMDCNSITRTMILNGHAELNENQRITKIKEKDLVQKFDEYE